MEQRKELFKVKAVNLKGRDRAALDAGYNLRFHFDRVNDTNMFHEIADGSI